MADAPTYPQLPDPKIEAYHRAKGTEDSAAKAEVNAELAGRFEATIARVAP